MNRRGIALAGNWIIDRIKQIDAYPAQDALANVLAVDECNGGSPHNVALDLVRLGVDFPIHALGLVGDDAAGRGILRNLAAHGVDTTGLCQVPGGRTSSTDVFAVAGRRTFFHDRGVNAAFDGTTVGLETIPARHLHLGYLLLLDAMDKPDPEFGTVAGRFLAHAQRLGMTTSVDLVSEDRDRFRSVVLPTLPYVDDLFANEFELERTTGIGLGDDPPPEVVARAAQQLFDAGLKRAVFFHTPRVAMAVLARGEVHVQPAVRLAPEHIRGTVGAGDAFAAGALFVLHDGFEVPAALRLGVAAATACILDPTTSNGVRSASECLALLNGASLET